jgi:uncharacterized membrane protein
MRVFQIISVIILTTIFCAKTLDGQSAKNIKTGALVGQLRDCYGNVVKSAKIKVKNEEFSRKRKSDKSGLFKFQLPEGIYEITVEKCGFKKVKIQNVNVQENSEKNINVDMQISYATDIMNSCSPYDKPCPSLPD